MTLPDLVSVCRFILAMLVFVLPGIGVATWLHGRATFHRTFRTLLGFGYSLAIVALVGWPFLWRQGSFASFQLVLGLVWILWCFAGILGYRLVPATSDHRVAVDQGPQL